MDSQEIQQKITQKLGVENLPEDKQRALIDQVTQAILQRVFYATMERLSEEERERLQEYTDDDAITPEHIDTFLREVITEYDAFLDATIDAFFEEMHVATTEPLV